MRKSLYFSVAVLLGTIVLQIYRPFDGIPVSLDRFFLLVSFFLFFLQLDKDKSISQLTLLVLMTVVLCAILTLLAFSWSGVLFYFYIMVATLVISDCFDSKAGVLWIRRSLLFALCIVLGFGFYQVIYILVFDKFPEAIPFTSIAVSPDSGHLTTILGKGGLKYGSDFYRLVFPFSRPQDFSFFIGLFLITYLILGVLIERNNKTFNTILVLVGLIFFVLSGSRSTQIALLASIGFTAGLVVFRFFAERFVGKTTFSFVLAFFAVIPLMLLVFLKIDVLGFLSSRLALGYDAHLMVRMEAISGLMDLSFVQFLFGVGFQNYPEFVGMGNYPHAHMTPLTLLVELGVVMGIVIFLAYGYVIVAALRQVSDCSNLPKSSFSYLYIRYGFISFILFANLFYDFGKALYFFLIISVILGAQRFVELRKNSSACRH